MERYIARQPIFDSQRVVYGYELLFRSGPENFFHGVQADVAAATAADNFVLFGMERLTDGRRAFLNCTREFLLRDYAMLLPKDRVVLEVLESVKLDEEVIGACHRLKTTAHPRAGRKSGDPRRLPAHLRLGLLALPGLFLSAGPRCSRAAPSPRSS